MAITECGNGHVYDNDQYAVCPYCNGGGNMINFGAGAGRTVAPGYGGGMQQAGMQQGGDFGRTVAPGYGGGSMNAGRTTAPAGYGQSPVMAGFGGEPGKTVAPESIRRRMDEQNKTVAVFKKQNDLDPVVGWLVCVEGKEKGRDYRLLARINNIGRGENMDVCIREDKTISKDCHAKLAYDQRHNNFMLIPGNSVNNIYLNDQPVYFPTELRAFDLIDIGESKLVFIPLCCERFSWDNGVMIPRY